MTPSSFFSAERPSVAWRALPAVFMLNVAFAIAFVAAPAARPQTFTVIHNFVGGVDGAFP